MNTFRRVIVLAALVVVSVGATLVFVFAARPSVVDAQSRTLLLVFQTIQQKAQTNPKFAFSIERYSGSTSGNSLSVSTINATANAIIDMGDNYVCLGSIKVDGASDVKTVCIPYSAIVSIQAENTLYN